MTRMVLNWLRQRTGAAFGPAPDAGERVYAIGDIHGRLDLLDDALESILADSYERRDADRTTLVFLGDYVDRGPQSAKVLERLRTLELAGLSCVFLRGNHEQALLDAALGVADDKQLLGWLTYGGRETLGSYGLPADLVYSTDALAIQQALKAAIPPADVHWLSRLPLLHQSGDYLFVHAGIRPGVPLADQAAHDLLWIREDFLDHKGSFGPVVVHGHSISVEVDWRPNRIGIDTGAYATGALTTLVLEGRQRRVMQTAAPD